MKKLNYVFIVLLMLGISMPIVAEQTASEFVHGRHAIRLGWGDMFLSNLDERLRAANIVSPENESYLDYVQGMPAPQAHEYLTHYRMSLDSSRKLSSVGHFFLGYRFQLTPLVGLGLEADVFASTDHFHMVDGYRTTVNEHAKNQLIHFTLMPTVRFTYYRQRMVELYSSVGVGYTFSKFTSAVPIEWGNGVESNTQGVALSTTLFGVNIGGKHWFAEAELGSLCTFPVYWPESTLGPIYGSRLLSVAVGYRF